MNNGLRGLSPGVGGERIVAGGSWGGNRGRIRVDELRLWGNADDGHGGSHAAARYVANNSQAGHISTIAYPGDLGAVANIGTGHFVCVGAPWSSAYNTAGTFFFTAANTTSGVQGSVFENNSIFQNYPGVACTMPNMVSLVAGTTYIADGAAVTLSTTPFTDVASNLIFSIVNGGTLATGTVYNYDAHVFINPGVTTTQRSAYHVSEDTTSGTLTTQIGFDCPLMVGATNNYQIALGFAQTATISASVGGALVEIGKSATFTVDFANATFPSTLRMSTATVLFKQSPLNTGATTFASHAPTYRNVAASTITMPVVVGYNSAPTIGPDTQTGLTGATSTDFRSAPTYSNLNSGTVTSAWSHNGYDSTFTLNATGSTVSNRIAYKVSDATASAGTITTNIGLDIVALAAGGTNNIGIRNLSSLRQQGALIGTPNVVTVTSNAGTVAVTAFVSNFTNSSAATMTITMATTGALDGQISIVRVYDATAASQTITWVNTENGEGTAPVTSNGSTTLPKTVMFMFNSGSSKWRTIIT